MVLGPARAGPSPWPGWGFAGVPLLVFPTAGGDAHEIERNELVAHLWPLIDAGRVCVYSCDSVAGQALVARRGEPAYRLWLIDQFHHAVAQEVLPAIRNDLGGGRSVVVAGASIGAFNALGCSAAGRTWSARRSA